MATLATTRAAWSLRIGLAFIWIYEGLVPKLLVPLTDFELDVVAACGLVPGGFEAPLLHLLGVLETMLGVLILLGVMLRPLCVIQAAVILFFTVVISTWHPTTLMHPFGLLSKNIPIIGAVVALWFLTGEVNRAREGVEGLAEVR